MPERRITSVLELAHYKVGDSAWWIITRDIHTQQRGDTTPPLSEDDAWMVENVHPKTLFEHGPYKSKWQCRTKLPRLPQSDFVDIVNLITSELVVERFDICDVTRSNDTGEFYYSNPDSEWMPQQYLMDTDVAARRERTRILKMIKRWANSHQ